MDPAHPMDRREFLGAAAATGASLAFHPGTLASIAARAAAQPTAERPKSRVVEVRAPGIVGENRRPDAARLRRMVEDGIRTLTGKSDLASAWKVFLKPDDVVGIKVNGWGGRLISTKRPVMEAAIDGARLAGVSDDRIVVFDHVEANLADWVREQKIETKEGGVRFLGCTPGLSKEHLDGDMPRRGFDTEPIAFPWGKVRLAELVSEEVTAILNLGVLKDHTSAGISGALKNLSHAVVDRPWRCHERFCDPYIGDIVAIPRLKAKLRLHVVDAVQGVAVGGPALRSLDDLLAEERLLLSTDPVALDGIGRRWVDRARGKRGLPPVAERTDGAPGLSGTPGSYIEAAQARGLGTADPERMEVVAIEVGS